MIALVREHSLSAPSGSPEYAVFFAPQVEADLEHFEEAEALIQELETVLGSTPRNPPGKERVVKLEGVEGLWRYRPHSVSDLRVVFAIEDHCVIVLQIFPRKNDYRSSDLRTAQKRLSEWRISLE